MNFTQAWGLDDGQSMVAELERILESAEEGASQWTMADVSGVRIIVADLNVYESVICSETTFPTLRVVDAIRASMSIPVMYRPFKCPINGHTWVGRWIACGLSLGMFTNERGARRGAGVCL